ncbi:hypothetical protein L9F63_019739 [Diploptera punctata]|uniref:Adenine phosphoribosyltransferase n=1 Tax=Diploptera punctata TaxID=6984 RepID=A0AAD8EE93_DIPPU|nr:hypothetical protein L9F63_019739 [Diploptera punctata]
MTDFQKKLEYVKKNIRSYPDFPKPGIIFRDIFSVLSNPPAFHALKDALFEHVSEITPKPDVIVVLESRGFLFGPIVALHNIPCVPVRKKGKLPGDICRQEYTLEYGTDVFEIQSDSIKAGQNVLVIDDLLATGGSLKAACLLVKQLKANVIQCLVVMELLNLKGRNHVAVPTHSLIQF